MSQHTPTPWQKRVEDWKAITITHQAGSDSVSQNIYRKVVADLEKVVNSHETLLEAAKKAKECLLNAGSDGHVITFDENQKNKTAFGELVLAIAQAEARP